MRERRSSRLRKGVPQRLSRDLVWAVGLLVPVALGGVFATGALLFEGLDVPREEDYVAVRAALDNEAFDVEQDRVAVLPAWSLRPLKQLRAFPWISTDHLEARPLHRVRDLYVVLEPDGEAAFDRFIEALQRSKPDVEPELRAEAGPVRLYKVSTGARTVVDDLAARLAKAQVSIISGSKTEACTTKRGTGWACKGRPHWQAVIRAHKLVTENGDLVLWTHPPGKNERTVIEWSDAQLGSQLVLRSGFTRTGSNWAKMATRVRVYVDDSEVGSVTRPVAFDFATHVFDTTAQAARPGPHKVKVVVDSRNNSKAHFAIDMFTAEPKGSAPQGTDGQASAQAATP